MKTVSLVDHDGVIPNLALMKLSTYYKAKGWGVNFNMPLFPADKIYVSKIFTFSPEVRYPGDLIVGGPGHDPHVSLEHEIDICRPDYSIYRCAYSMGYTSRGCPNSCGFCIIPTSEGAPRSTGDIYSFWDPLHKEIRIMDSNVLFDLDHFFKIANQIKKEDLEVRFEQGLDIRRIDARVSRTLAGLRYKKYQVSWDTESIQTIFEKNIEILCKYVSCQRVGVHILTGYDTSIEYDYYRIVRARSLGLAPFVMVYNKRRDSPMLTYVQKWANSRYLTNLPLDVFMRNEHASHILESSSLSSLC